MITGYTVNGNAEIVSVAIEALEALPLLLQRTNCDLAEFRAYENMPVHAVLTDDDGAHMYAWTREQWETQ